MKVNDKVVCVDKTPIKGRQFQECLALLSIGTVYTVSETATCKWTGRHILWLTGLPHPPVDEDGDKCMFGVTRFRLVSEVGHPPIAFEQPQEVGA